MLNHVGLCSTSEKNSDRFFVGILGLKKQRDFCVSRELTEEIFGISREHKVIVYAGKNLNFEVFITDKVNPDKIDHVCLNLKNIDQLFLKCEKEGLAVKKISRGDRFIYFLQDFDGNLYEIKEKL
ncbi:MAG: hypothetical protein P9M03_01715 [Candidatus Theseobacter exili]|nr:hypothetical protein [Candidatus Theseobacter exili]